MHHASNHQENLIKEYKERKKLKRREITESKREYLWEVKKRHDDNQQISLLIANYQYSSSMKNKINQPLLQFQPLSSQPYQQETHKSSQKLKTQIHN